MFSLRPHQQRAFFAMQEHNIGQVIVPTGGGKTFIMIADAYKRLRDNGPQTIVVVAPRILLANQLCEEFLEQLHSKRNHIMHVHSGETKHFSTTKSDKIALFNNTARTCDENCIIFTTYHSLGRVVDSGINIDTIYFDEAHNGCQRSHFVGVYAMSKIADRKFYFTATPRIGRGVSAARGMNNAEVWGNMICNVPAPELIEQGAIVSPKILPFDANDGGVEFARTKHNMPEVDAYNLMQIVEGLDSDHDAKILVAAPNTRVLWAMLTQTDIMSQLKEKGYDIMHITSKHGAYINKTKVGREKFFQTLTQWGLDDNKKFVIFHYSILSEGINVPGLTHTILLRNLPIVEMAQTIGRVIRVHKDDRDAINKGALNPAEFQFFRKPHGYVTVPVCGKAGNAITTRLQRVVDAIFKEGIPPLSFV